jgi:hypothetical protein
MQRTIGIGWLVGAIAVGVLVIGFLFFLADRPRSLHTNGNAQASGRQMPSQPFVPKAAP